MQAVKNNAHMAITIIAALRLAGRPDLISASACRRDAAITMGGIIFRSRAMPSGNSIRSSSRPSIGIKSGIRSIGLNA